MPVPCPPKRRECPTPTKRSFPTLILAEKALALQVQEMAERNRTDRVPNRVYPCECSQWHMTSNDHKELPHERANTQAEVLVEAAAS